MANSLDALGLCGGPCTADVDADGICDDVDPCIGANDACDLCNGPGRHLRLRMHPHSLRDCDCDGNLLDAIGVCGGGCETLSMRMDFAMMWTASETFDTCGICNGPCGT